MEVTSSISRGVTSRQVSRAQAPRVSCSVLLPQHLELWLACGRHMIKVLLLGFQHDSQSPPRGQDEQALTDPTPIPPQSPSLHTSSSFPGFPIFLQQIVLPQLFDH